MARLIRATPKLNKEESEKFIRKMIETENSPISKIDKKLTQGIKQIEKIENEQFA